MLDKTKKKEKKTNHDLFSQLLPKIGKIKDQYYAKPFGLGGPRKQKLSHGKNFLYITKFLFTTKKRERERRKIILNYFSQFLPKLPKPEVECLFMEDREEYC